MSKRAFKACHDPRQGARGRLDRYGRGASGSKSGVRKAELFATLPIVMSKAVCAWRIMLPGGSASRQVGLRLKVCLDREEPG